MKRSLLTGLILAGTCLASVIAGGAPAGPNSKEAPASEPGTPPSQHTARETGPSEMANSLPVPGVEDERPVPELWDMAAYPFDEEALRQGVLDHRDRGFSPVGMHIVPSSSILVLYSRIDFSGVEWSLVAIEPLTEVNSVVSEYLASGWQPIDMHLNEDSMYLLAKNAHEEFLSWRIVELNLGDSVQKAMELAANSVAEQLASNRYLYAISADQGKLSLLFVEASVAPVGRRLVIQAFENDGSSPFLGLENLTGAGGLPAGLAVTEDYVFIPFYF